MEMDDKKELSRREFLAWAAAATALLVLPGCEPAYQAEVAPARTSRASSSNAFASTYTPGYASYASSPYGGTSYGTSIVDPNAPLLVPDPPPAIINGSGGYVHTGYTTTAQPTYVQTTYTMPAPQPTYTVPSPAPVVQAPQPVVTSMGGKVSAVSRNSWAVVPPNPQKMRAMNGVRRLTIHHEGSAKPNNDTTPNQVAATLRLIQGQHHKRMGAGDIGYHFIIDRTGTIWQGRDSRYQGAHTSGANSNNIGVMLLGNFEIQQPTQQQLATLRTLVTTLSRMYRLNPQTDIFGHSDFCNTQCPGKHLKSTVQAMRQLRI